MGKEIIMDGIEVLGIIKEDQGGQMDGITGYFEYNGDRIEARRLKYVEVTGDDRKFKVVRYFDDHLDGVVLSGVTAKDANEFVNSTPDFPNTKYYVLEDI